tara:strand:- start:76 stop:276 length:201 start_codon:yes stop_codon:yes gene_type:complete
MELTKETIKQIDDFKLAENSVKELVIEKIAEIEKWISVRKKLNRYPLIKDPKEQELYNNLKYWLEN